MPNLPIIDKATVKPNQCRVNKGKLLNQSANSLIFVKQQGYVEQ